MIWKYLLWAFFAVGVLFASAYFLTYAVTQFQMDTAERRGQAGESERVVADPDRRVALREEFYDLCSTIESQNRQIENQQALIDATTDEEEKAKLRAGLTGIQNTRNENIEEYNSKAANDETRGFLRSTELPAEIDPEEEEIECGTAQ
jgi:hypothetical protein